MPNLPVNGYYLTLGLLVACTILGIGVAARFRREVDEDLAPITKKELLAPLEQAYYAGLMHPEEIERIRDSVKKATLADTTPKKLPAPANSAGGDVSFLLMADGSSFDAGCAPADGGCGSDAG